MIKVPPIPAALVISMAFDATIIHWPTIAEFVTALATIKRPSWCKGITNHNTYIPNEDQWRGLSSMNSMRATYIGKGWSSGPNLYLCAKAPKASDTGIWQMTPITRPGTHAGACNSDHLGIENVGDFDRAPPSADQYAMLITINLLIMQAWGLPPSSINVHNECMTGRTCPGKYVTGTQIRADLGKKPAPVARRYRVRGIPVYEQSDRTGPQWGCLKQDELIEIDNPKNGHLKDGRGFIRFDPDTLEAV